jgi:hypothetical protein
MARADKSAPTRKPKAEKDLSGQFGRRLARPAGCDPVYCTFDTRAGQSAERASTLSATLMGKTD